MCWEKRWFPEPWAGSRHLQLFVSYFSHKTHFYWKQQQRVATETQKTWKRSCCSRNVSIPHDKCDRFSKHRVCGLLLQNKMQIRCIFWVTQDCYSLEDEQIRRWTNQKQKSLKLIQVPSNGEQWLQTASSWDKFCVGAWPVSLKHHLCVMDSSLSWGSELQLYGPKFLLKRRRGEKTFYKWPNHVKEPWKNNRSVEEVTEGFFLRLLLGNAKTWEQETWDHWKGAWSPHWWRWLLLLSFSVWVLEEQSRCRYC